MINLSIAAVIISEIAWMGTITSVNDEWMELYNNTDSPINLVGWLLKAADDTPKINLTGIIPANGFYLLERTDDTTVPNIPSDQIYTGALENSGEILELYDNSGNLIDKVDSSGKWPAGDNTAKQTMERVDNQTWQTSQNPGGTPRAKNSLTREPETQSIEPEPQTSAQPTQPQPEIQISEPVEPATYPVIYPSDIFFNEILPSPEGPDETEEWIEIFNQNNFEADLSGWQITDTAGKTNTYVFPAGTKISALGFLILGRPETKIILNNDRDGLSFVQPDGKIADSVSYEKAPQSQSYNLTESGWIWSSILTPGAINRSPTSAKTPTKGGEEGEKGAEKGEKGLAAISESVATGQGKRNFYPFLAAFALAIFSATIILILKKGAKKTND